MEREIISTGMTSTTPGVTPGVTPTIAVGDRGVPATFRARRGVRLRAIVRATRPIQWTKNALVVLALVFSHHATDPAALAAALVAGAAFVAASSAVYLFNDLMDREADRRHPTKRLRPLASGALDTRAACVALACCVAVSGALALALPRLGALAARPDPFGRWGGSETLLLATLLAYLALNAAYSLWLKHLVLWDVFVIAAGFVLRAMAGAFAIGVPISPWFYLCATFVALFLALGKRRAELSRHDSPTAPARASRAVYSLPLLDQLISVTVTCALLTYGLYTFQGEGASHALMLTLPVVLFGVCRYLYLMYARGEGEQPEVLLWRDRQLLGCVLAYIAVVATVLYGLPALGATVLYGLPALGA